MVKVLPEPVMPSRTWAGVVAGQAAHQLADRGRLIAGRLERRLELEQAPDAGASPGSTRSARRTNGRCVGDGTGTAAVYRRC
jgi:hypothetical protein